MPSEYHQTTWCAQQAIHFIEANAGFDQPWLFSMNPFDPHPPFDPPLERLERYLDHLADIPLPCYRAGELDAKPIFQQIDHRGAYNRPGYFAFPDMSDDDHRLIRAAYWAMVDLIDEQVGRVLEALDRTDQRHNTMVIFMSDHGEMLGDHGLYHKGPYFYEPCARVPLIIAWPGRVAAGQRRSALVELADLAPTLLEAATLEPHVGMQGKSFLRLLTDEAAPDDHRTDAYSEYYNANLPHDPPAYATMLRTERYKLVVAHGQEVGELYDLECDANEAHNLWNDSQYAQVKTGLMKRLCDRMAWTVDPLPVRAAGWSARKEVRTGVNERHTFTI
jgi:arylsulfatase